MLKQRVTRRSLLAMGFGLAGAGVLAACGAATPTQAPAKPTEPAKASDTSAPKPTEAPKPAAAPTQAPAAAAPTNTPAAAAKPAEPTKPAAAEPTKPAPAAQPAAGAKAPAEITWTSWATDTYGKFRVEEQVAEFNKIVPNIAVKLRNEPSQGYMDKLLTNLAAGNGPDIFRVGWEHVPPLIRQNQIVETEPLFKAQADTWFAGKDLKAGIVDTFRFKGKLYGFPIGLDMPALFINKTLFDAEKLSYPPEDYGDAKWTFPALQEMAKKLTKSEGGKTTQFGIDMIDTGWYMIEGLVAGNGGRLLSEDLKEFLWHSPEATEAIQWVADLRNKEKAAPSSAQAEGGAFDFVNGKVAMSWTEVSQAVYRTRDVINKFNWDMLPWPTFPGKKQITILDPSSDQILKASKQPDAAWTFFHFLVGPGGQRITAEMGWALPIFSSLDEKYNIRIADFKKNIKPGINGPKFLVKDFPMANPRFGEAYDLVSSELDNVFVGKATAKEAMARVKPKADKLLAQGAGEQ
ncbi:MAG TPA: sugar ABC transporter substrate-binding protein [Chloroflexota bacterium]